MDTDANVSSFIHLYSIRQALGHLLSVGNDAMERLMQEVILPALKKIVFDRTPALRKQLVGVVSGWLRQENNYFKVSPKE